MGLCHPFSVGCSCHTISIPFTLLILGGATQRPGFAVEVHWQSGTAALSLHVCWLLQVFINKAALDGESWFGGGSKSRKACSHSPLTARISEIPPGEEVLIISMYLSATVYLNDFLVIFHFATELYDHGLNGNITVGREWGRLGGDFSLQEVL